MFCCSVLCSVPNSLSDSHGHDDVPISVLASRFTGGPQLAGAVCVLEVECGLCFRCSAQEIHQVGSVEADLYRATVIIRRKALFALAGLGQRRMYVQFAFLHAQPNSAGTFVRELRYTLDGLAQFFAIRSEE